MEKKMTERPLLRYVPAWDNQPFVERLNLALKALRIHGILTEAEYKKAFGRLSKQWEKQDFAEKEGLVVTDVLA